MLYKKSRIYVVMVAVLVAGSANAQTINVNLYATSGGWAGIQQDEATLDGPAGGLGETWNQFNTTSGIALLDSTGAATSVGFTNNITTGWGWGSPDLSLIQAGKAHFGKGTDTTHKISGLTPGNVYDIWVASYAHNTTLGERAMGEWSTSNPTTTVGAQIIDSRTSGLNGTSWQHGVNYVLFENVEADLLGEIVLIGDAADGTAEQPEYGETYSTRLPLNGFQIVEVTDPIQLTLQVNTVTGQITILGDATSPRDINYYQITSAGNAMNLAGWNSLADQDFDGNGPADGSGNGWEEGGGVGTHGLAEGYLLGDSTIPADAQISLGTAYDTSVDAQDLVFNYRSDTGQRIEGIVEYIATLPGDFNSDGTVEAADLALLLGNWGQSVQPTGWLTNWDGFVDANELADLLSNWGVGISNPQPPDTSTLNNIPEPTAILLLALSGLGLISHRKA